MIFVYPAIVSKNVDSKIAVAISTSLEQFFLLHLAESFSSGTLRVKSVYEPRKEVYGPLVLENKKNSGKLLQEEKHVTPDSIQSMSDQVGVCEKTIGEVSELEKENKWKASDFIESSIKDEASLNSALSYLENLKSKYDHANIVLVETDKIVNSASEAKMDSNDRWIHHKLKEDFSELKGFHIDKTISLLDNLIRKIKDSKRDLDKSKSTAKDEIKRNLDQEKREEEKKEKELQQYETHGQYKVDNMKGVSFKPSMMNLSVKIHYVGGPHEDASRKISPSETFQDIAIGAKVTPLVLSDFDTIENAILDDYFASNFQNAWRSTYRNILRKGIGWLEKVVGTNFDITSKLGAVNKEILLAPKGFIDAASFKHKSESPEFYNYAAAIVMLNKDDLTKEEGANFFLDKNQLQKMFRAGWNSFCILDPIKEEVTFISSLDGGNMHVLPYAYIFHNIGLEKIYSGMEDLQRRSPLLRRKVGTFSRFLSKIKHENRMLTMTRKLLRS